MVGKGARVFRNIYKGHMDRHMDKIKGRRIKGAKWGWLVWRGSGGGEMETTVLEQ